ncbi:LPS export ABC transporter periplasmic protein LptC [Erwinia sp. OLTSP20]|uniref:LPS export ABC transporter periplasmic protein LptC n=1 Tax=unclassified Erwinia TaxID=2622719 RepID=UPI000C183285|nr:MULTISPECIES: LPS export ABC transporter periplasmic protein LptC [unclassified Erwinia]PIJ51048.1 LPS export ABC transporter periplasmic protein LptC [Erwinia sp. OAMSP11]PIJ73684.1 LPS export ABC transporter periplasmic protein LptC [Erwinia sp. OLSSP12]PIJ83041.1 LPS export ABC transporter periplasmic protein LptC [Erwinia sp. OLCASP19]PIJ85640.1 LPS export ABC transporter periplasmic protein LptC [Erwinia sp. OLMTSP26]PIJ87711.1 LPS export ABC transporter periplasmic protein LptC [Erwin
MSKLKRWITLILALIALILIGWNMADNGREADNQNQTKQNEPDYTSDRSDTVVYSPTGSLNYRLVSEKVTYYTNEAVSWFEKPVMTVFDDNKVPIWSVRSDKARLTNDRMLYLYGHVEVNSLTSTSQLQRIVTDTAVINLTTLDVTSDEQVTLYGTNFNSTGMKMRGNLRKKTAQLIEKVKTSYEIQNEKQH